MSIRDNERIRAVLMFHWRLGGVGFLPNICRRPHVPAYYAIETTTAAPPKTWDTTTTNTPPLRPEPALRQARLAGWLLAAPVIGGMAWAK
jgi:hypothetical protein